MNSPEYLAETRNILNRYLSENAHQHETPARLRLAGCPSVRLWWPAHPRAWNVQFSRVAPLSTFSDGVGGRGRVLDQWRLHPGWWGCHWLGCQPTASPSLKKKKKLSEHLFHYQIITSKVQIINNWSYWKKTQKPERNNIYVWEQGCCNYFAITKLRVTEYC